MKLSLTLSLLLGLATLFQGCSDSTDSSVRNPSTTTTSFSGRTTLASTSARSTTVCIDTNYNKQCDANEPTTSTDNEGAYSFTTTQTVEEGMLLIVKDGMSIIPFKDANKTKAENLQFYKSYQAQDYDQNINVISTLIANKLEENGDDDYQKAINDFANTYPKYIDPDNGYFDSRIDKEDLTFDPIEESLAWISNPFEDITLLYFSAALQNIFYDNPDINIKSKAIVRSTAADGEPLTEQDTLDDFYDVSASYFSDLTTYLEDFINWITTLGDADDEGTTTGGSVPDEPVNKPQLVEIQRDNLNGIWFIIDASGDRTCSDIRSNNDIAVTEADGKTTNLSLTYDNNKKTMLLKLGFFTADTIKFSEYYDDETFNGNYESDGETLKGYKVATLDICKYDDDKLGL